MPDTPPPELEFDDASQQKTDETAVGYASLEAAAVARRDRPFAQIRVNPFNPQAFRQISFDRLIAESGRPMGTGGMGGGASVGFVHRKTPSDTDRGTHELTREETQALYAAEGLGTARLPATPPAVAAETNQLKTQMAAVGQLARQEAHAMATLPNQPAPLVGPLKFDLGQGGTVEAWFTHVELSPGYLVLASRVGVPGLPVFTPPLRKPDDPTGPLKVHLPLVSEPVRVYHVGIRFDFMGHSCTVLVVDRRPVPATGGPGPAW